MAVTTKSLLLLPDYEMALTSNDEFFKRTGIYAGKFEKNENSFLK